MKIEKYNMEERIYYNAYWLRQWLKEHRNIFADKQLIREIYNGSYVIAFKEFSYYRNKKEIWIWIFIRDKQYGRVNEYYVIKMEGKDKIKDIDEIIYKIEERKLREMERERNKSYLMHYLDRFFNNWAEVKELIEILGWENYYVWTL